MRWMAVILAAGKGTRMRSDLPKVLHQAAGRSLIDLVLDSAGKMVADESILVVVGHGADQLRTHLRQRSPSIGTVLQMPQCGTGDALRVAMDSIAPDSPDAPDAVFVLSGDVPLLRTESLEKLRATLESGAEAALLTARLHQPGAYGRVLRNSSGGVEAIVEARDANAETLAINEVNAGIYVFRTPSLRRALQGLAPENAQAEYYLTDVVATLREWDLKVEAVQLERPVEMFGVNTRGDLARVSQVLVERGGESACRTSNQAARTET